MASWGQDGQDVTRTRNLAGNDHDGWEMAVRSEEDNTNSILDTTYKSPPGLGVRQGGAVSHPNQHGPIVKPQSKASNPGGVNGGDIPRTAKRTHSSRLFDLTDKGTELLHIFFKCEK